MLWIENPDAVDKQQVKNMIRINSRIDRFLEISDYCAVDGYLTESARRLAQQTTVFGEGFFSGRKPGKRGRVSFEENLTLVTAKRFVKQGGGKVAVLNFANPVEPGGGVLRGADAQEEYLCRSSDLYQSLISANAAPYYAANKAILDGEMDQYPEPAVKAEEVDDYRARSASARAAERERQKLSTKQYINTNLSLKRAMGHKRH